MMGETILDRVKLSGMVILVASLPFSESIKTISLILLLLILIVQLAKNEASLALSVIHYGFILMLISALVTSIFAENHAKSLKGAKDIFFYVIPFLAASTLRKEKHSRMVLWSLYAATAISVSLGIIHSINIHRPLEIHALGNQNYTAMFLIIVVISVINTIIFSDRETGTSKGILGGISLLIIIGAVMTAMRTSFIALFLFFTVLFLYFRHLRSVRLISAGIIGLITVSAYLYDPIRTKLTQTASLNSRFFLWNHAISLLKENPFFGIGLNHFKFTFPDSSPEPGATYYDAHSLYFQTASQMGLLGIVALGLIIFGFMNIWLKSKPETGLENAVKYGALGGFLVTFAGGLLDTTLHHEHAIAFTFLAGLMCGLRGDNSSKSFKRKKI